MNGEKQEIHASSSSKLNKLRPYRFTTRYDNNEGEKKAVELVTNQLRRVTQGVSP